MLTSMAQRNDLRTGLSAARACTDALFSLVRADSFYERPIPERHRLIFYLGHLEAFDWNQICQGALALFPFHSEFDRLFAFGIDPPEGQLPSDVAWDWPRVSEVQSYNRRVRQTLDKVLDDAPEHLIHVRTTGDHMVTCQGCGLHGRFNGMGPAGHGELAVAEGLLACGADGDRVKVGTTGVLEDDGLGAGITVAIAPLLEGQQDRVEILTGIGEQVLVARGALGVQAPFDDARLFELA